MSFSRLLFILLVLTLFATPILCCEALEAEDELEALSAIDKAELAMASAYGAVLDAEHNGANVLDLLAKLNVAGEHLANARIWCGLGEFENATRFATLCYDVAEQVTNEAVRDENEAYGLWVKNLWFRMLVSVIGVIFVIFLSSLIWRAFRRRYDKRLSKMKVERT